jgi:hypothetical protein
MRATVDIDPQLETELSFAQELTREKQATVIRLALRVGLPLVIDRFQSPRPVGYFDSDYRRAGRGKFERKMAAGARQRPER